jgi:hypothetical protein
MERCSQKTTIRSIGVSPILMWDLSDKTKDRYGCYVKARRVTIGTEPARDKITAEIPRDSIE